MIALADKPNCPAVMPNEPCPTCGWRYRDADGCINPAPHAMLPVESNRCNRCYAYYNLDVVTCSACGSTPPAAMTVRIGNAVMSERMQLLQEKNKLRAARGLVPLTGDEDAVAQAPENMIGRTFVPGSRNFCQSCGKEWDLHSVFCHCGYRPASDKEIKALLDAKNAVRANYNLPPLVIENATKPPAKVVMHPTASDHESARRHGQRFILSAQER
jgi:hypothetical protein